MTNRSPIPSAVHKKLVIFYGSKNCVVSGHGADWHHLDENPINSVFENLVPLAHPLNTILGGMDRSAGANQFMTSVDLLPHNLIVRADLQYLQWNVAAAYGCSRLAAFVGRKYTGSSPEELSLCACRSLWFARHRSEPSLFVDVLVRDLLPVMGCNTLEPLSVITIAHECASLLSEFGRPTEAAQALGRLNTLLPEWKKITALYPYRYAGLIRREAIVEIGLGGDQTSAMEKLTESELAAPKNLAASVGAANARAWASYLRRDYSGARKAIEPLLQICLNKMFQNSTSPTPITIPVAMAAELMLIEYAARIGMRDGFKDSLGTQTQAALFGLGRLAKFSLPLVHPSLAQDASMMRTFADFENRKAGDWSRAPIRDEAVRTIATVIRDLR